MDVLSFTPNDYFGSNMYIIASDSECAVIDPSMCFCDFESIIKSRGYSVKYVILTHAHFDHICEIDTWVAGCPSAEVIIGVGDAGMLSDSYMNCYKLFLGFDKGYFGKYTTVSDSDVLALGKEQLLIIETPGHTSGSISIASSDEIFVGDTIFADGGVGRCDLPGGDIRALKESVKRLLSFPPEITVYSGHGNVAKMKDIKINFI